jgi:protease PrsW
MYFALAVLPGLILLTWVYMRNRLFSGSKKAVYRLFLLGAAIVLPAGLIEQLMLNSDHLKATGFNQVLFTAFFVAGMIEEFLKASIVDRMAFQKGLIRKSVDGIVYASAVALGFATIENILYVTSNGFSTALLRSVTAVPAHFMFGIIMGFYFGLSLRRPRRKVLAYIIPAVCHGLYDTFALSQSFFMDFILVIYLALLVELSLRIIDKTHKIAVAHHGI